MQWNSPDASREDFPCNELQALIVRPVKGILATRNGMVHLATDPSPGMRTGGDPLVALMVIERRTHVLYAELQQVGDADLTGFFARAWCQKKASVFRGIPRCLLVSPEVKRNAKFGRTFEFLESVVDIELEETRGSLKLGGRPVASFAAQNKKAIKKFVKDGDELPLSALQAGSAQTSTAACFVTTMLSKDAFWKSVPPASEAFLSAVDGQYMERAAWRHLQWSLVMKGEIVTGHDEFGAD